MTSTTVNPDLTEPAQSSSRIYNTRKVRACVTCRNLKIKCKIPPNGGPCQRCQNRGTTCRVESNVQSLLHENTRWKNDLTDRVSQLQTAVNVLLRTADLPALSSYSSSTSGRTSEMRDAVASHPEEITEAIPIAESEEQRTNEIYGSPINSLFQVTSSQPGKSPSSDIQDPLATDFISRRLVSEIIIQRLFQNFQARLDHFCYDVMCPHETLNSLRRHSSLLTVAISTVAALHDPDGSVVFRNCHAEFQKQVSSRMFSQKYSTDDIRALIIGSYWLGNLSYNLTGHCIRVATRLNYHLAYYSAIQGDFISHDKARLWYILYILDHHLSILYGRPAIIHPNQEPYQRWETFIQSRHGGEPDGRMGSQIALYYVTAKAKDIFGSHRGQIPEHSLYQLRSIFADLDRWYMGWGNRMQVNPYVGHFPIDGAILHYHFARLHLCTYIFRGMSPESAATASDQVKEYATLAVSSATSVLELVLEREDLNKALVGMPIYFHYMITFAAVFLINAASTNFSGLTMVDSIKVLDLLQRCVYELRSKNAARQHFVYHLGNGLEHMISRFLTPDRSQNGAATVSSGPMPLASTVDSLFMLDASDLFQYALDPNEQSPNENQYQWSI